MNSTYNGIASAMSSGGAPPDVASQRAYGIIDRMLDAQATVFSYVDVFRYLAIACFLCGLIVFLMRRVRPRGGPVIAD